MPVQETPSAVIQALGLTKRYGAQVVLAGVDLEVRRGEILGLVGVNGAGKTTLIECVLGLREPDSGRIEVLGEVTPQGRRAARGRLGVQLQTLEMQDKLRVGEAVALHAAYHGKKADHALLGRFGLADRVKAPFDSLSLGERQRLAAVLACAHGPELLILDEPTASMDPAARADYERVLLAFRADGGTVLLSTHDLGEAVRVCDRIAVLHEGRIQKLVTSGEVDERTGAVRALRVGWEPAVEAVWFLDIVGVESAVPARGGWRLLTRDLTATVAALGAKASRERMQVTELELERPRLEEVLLGLLSKDPREVSP